jgi:hypothetical protein
VDATCLFGSKAPVFALAAALVTPFAQAPAMACVEGDLRGEAVTIERQVGTTASGEKTAVNVLGAGWFRAAEIVKEGGSSDQTSVTLEVDGEPVLSTSFAILKNAWMQLNTPFIVATVRTEGGTNTMTLWYSPELKFRAMLAVRVDVHEDGVEALRVRTVMNKPAPHEHIPGQPGTAVAMPAFR